MNVDAESVRNLLETAMDIGREDARRAGELLGRVAPIYAEKRELQEKRLKDGELFNIFDILQRRTDEVKGHSAFISTLLDPNAPHGCDDEFLTAFCDTMGIKDFDCANATVDQNMHIGQRGNQRSPEGYIDIVIKQADGKRIIAIENKIYAGDQHKQILRYSAYCKQHYDYGNWTLFYLTLDGHKPTDDTLESGKDYKTISYKRDIAAWLNRAKDIAASNANVSSSIAQYINLVGQLTKQNEEDQMDADIIDVLIENDGKNLTVAEEIASKIDEAKCELFRRNIGKRLAEELKKYGKVNISGNMGKANDGFEIRNKDWPDSVSIWFVFENNNWSNLFSGIYFADTSKKTQAKRHYIASRSETDKLWCGEENLSSDDYPYSNYMPSEYRNLDTPTLIKIAHDPTDFCNAVKERVGHYASIIDDALKPTN